MISLIENSGHIVSKDDLMARVWPDTYVEETNLAQNISTLRKALGEREDGGQYIETVSKRGYRFVVRVKRISIDRDSAGASYFNVDEASVLAAEKKGNRPAASTVESVRSTDASAKKITAGMRLGHYEIIAPIGAGGMGEVYLGRDTRLDRKVALKLLLKEYTQDARSLRRFIREAKAVSALNHPNILTVYEIREMDGVHFIAAEFIEGETLRSMIARGPMAPLLAIEIAIQLTGALEAAHAAGIVHRDIKPENIMVRPDGYAKILDFGVAKLVEPRDSHSTLANSSLVGHQTDSGLITGTLDYMSPEQARGIVVDERSDLFSFGVVLYEMITGRAPFAGETTSDVLVNVIGREPIPASQLVSGVTPGLKRVIERSLQKDRDRRIQSASELQTELKHLRHEIEMSSHLVTKVIPRDRPSASASYAVAGTKKAPEIHYARSGDVNIAYQVIGNAPLDLVFVMGWVSHLEYFWAEPLFARFLNRLASFSRLILFDKRGTGLSDRVPVHELPTLEQRMDDVRAVMDAVGSKHAVLCGVSEGGPLCSLFAATYPEKVTALIMIGTYAKRAWAPDYPWAPTVDQREKFFEEIRTNWGGPVGIEERAPSLASDSHFRDWWAAYLRMGASPGAALALTQMNAEIDVRHVLPTIRVPTLILHRTDDLLLKVEEGRFVASSIPGAKLVEFPGADHLPFVGDQEAILDEIEEFLTGMRHASERDTVLATVLASRVVYSESQQSKLGSERWQELLGHLSEHTSREIELFKGREIEQDKDFRVAAFDGPARAIRAACAISDTARRLGISVQTGLHTGECEVLGQSLGGLAVDIGVQIAGRAAIDEVLVSSTVKDLVAGSGIAFAEHGSRRLTGAAGEWRLFSVVRKSNE